VVEQEAAEDGVRRRARAQPLGPFERPAPVTRPGGRSGGKPAHAGPEAARPVAVGRRRPLALGVGVVGEGALDLRPRLVDAPDHPLERALEDVRHLSGKVTRDAEPDFRFERRTRQGIIVLRPQGTSRSEDLGGDPMSSHRARIVLLVAVFTLLSARAAPAQEQAPPHIKTALTFLTAWGGQRWDELKTVAAVQVTVKVG